VKTGRRTGKQVHIPLFPAALDVLNRRQGGRPLDPKAFVFPAVAESYRNDPTALTKRVAVTFRRAGMETTEERTDRQRGVAVYGAHSFRHLFATAATAAGMPAAMLKAITGHATDSMLEHYQHLGAELAAELASRIGHGAAPALPATDPLTVLREKVRVAAEKLTAQTWQEVRDELNAIAAG
jgi:integrase